MVEFLCDRAKLPAAAAAELSGRLSELGYETVEDLGSAVANDATANIMAKSGLRGLLAFTFRRALQEAVDEESGLFAGEAGLRALSEQKAAVVEKSDLSAAKVATEHALLRQIADDERDSDLKRAVEHSETQATRLREVEEALRTERTTTEAATEEANLSEDASCTALLKTFGLDDHIDEIRKIIGQPSLRIRDLTNSDVLSNELLESFGLRKTKVRMFRRSSEQAAAESDNGTRMLAVPEELLDELMMTNESTDAAPWDSANDDDVLTRATQQIERSGSGNIRVVVRARPPNLRELAGDGSDVCVEVSPKHNTVQIGDRAFTFDVAFPIECTQLDVFNGIGVDLVQQVWSGYNASLFAYGQTSSGKTHSMMGVRGDEALAGLIPRICNLLFSSVHKFLAEGDEKTHEVQVLASYIEVYNEAVSDLLGGCAQLKLREDPKEGIIAAGMVKVELISADGAMATIEKGASGRSTAATAYNSESSRSHAIFELHVKKRYPTPSGDMQSTSRLSLTDLAGSERSAKVGSTGQTLLEGNNINKSLATLGKCIRALVDVSRGKKLLPPFRESVLTLYLRESLAGNVVTTMLANVSPVRSNVDETLSTLRYAASAKNIKTLVRKNEDRAQQRIRELTAENEALKRELELSKQNIIAAKRLAQLVRGQRSLFPADAYAGSATISEGGRLRVVGAEDDECIAFLTKVNLAEVFPRIKAEAGGTITLEGLCNADFVSDKMLLDFELNKAQIRRFRQAVREHADGASSSSRASEAGSVVASLPPSLPASLGYAPADLEAARRLPPARRTSSVAVTQAPVGDTEHVGSSARGPHSSEHRPQSLSLVGGAGAKPPKKLLEFKTQSEAEEDSGSPLDRQIGEPHDAPTLWSSEVPPFSELGVALEGAFPLAPESKMAARKREKAVEKKRAQKAQAAVDDDAVAAAKQAQNADVTAKAVGSSVGGGGSGEGGEGGDGSPSAAREKRLRPSERRAAWKAAKEKNATLGEEKVPSADAASATVQVAPLIADGRSDGDGDGESRGASNLGRSFGTAV